MDIQNELLGRRMWRAGEKDDGGVEGIVGAEDMGDKWINVIWLRFGCYFE